LSSRISAAARIAASRFNTSCSDDSPGRTCLGLLGCLFAANREQGNGSLCRALSCSGECSAMHTADNAPGARTNPTPEYIMLQVRKQS
jgi:hypothetical protein